MIQTGIQFYLASASPRRRDLLAGVGLRFDVVAVDIDERARKNERAGDFVVRIALGKARRAVEVLAERSMPELPILAADTCVTVDGRIQGKPTDPGDAAAMLQMLSGRRHQVYTAVALINNADIRFDTSCTRVTFKQLSRREIDAYCASGEPMDKAGAYAVQGRASAFVKHIEGSYTGVVGLPMFETHRLLAQIGIDWL